MKIDIESIRKYALELINNNPPSCGVILSNEEGQDLMDSYEKQFARYLGEKAYHLYTEKGLPLSVSLKYFEEHALELFAGYIDVFILGGNQ